jgi:hypothetical protein
VIIAERSEVSVGLDDESSAVLLGDLIPSVRAVDAAADFESTTDDTVVEES